MILGGALLLTSTLPLSALLARIALAPFIFAMEIHGRRRSLRQRPSPSEEEPGRMLPITQSRS